MPVEAIIYDLGNVLIHVDEPRLLSRLAARSTKSPAELVEFFRHSPLMAEFGTGRCSPQDFHAQAAQTIGLSMEFAEFAGIWSDMFSPIEPTLALAAALKGRLKQVILSNTNVLHADYLLREFPVIHDFDGYVFSNEVGLLKPDARIYGWTLKRYDLEAVRTVFIDDLAVNVAGARAAGLLAIQCHNPAQVRQELLALGVNVPPPR